MQPKPMGRPPVENPRRHTVTVRLNDSERDALTDAAAVAGQPVGVWARERLVEAATKGGAR